MTALSRIRAPYGLALVGISHHTAELDVLENLALRPEEIAAFYEAARARAELANVLVLSTCNRTELYGFGANEAALGPVLLELLRAVVGSRRFPEQQHLYARCGHDSLVHLSRVAAGVDSMILGEAQIMGQVKEAYETAGRFRQPEPAFERFMQTVFAAAKRSRSETEIGKGAVSVASAAVHVAMRIFHDMSQRTVVVVGAGDTGRLVLEHFRDHKAKRTIIVNRTLERAERLAETVNGLAWPWARLPEAIAQADVLACAVRTTEPVIDNAMLDRALAHRAGHPLAVLDLGLPRNVAPTIHRADVFINDLDAFRQVVDANLGRRKMEVSRVEAIIAEELDKLSANEQTAHVGPLIVALRDSVESIRRAEVARATAGMSPSECAAVDRATASVVNKLLHGPTTSIKQLARSEGDARQMELVWELVRRLKGNGSRA